MIKKNFLKEKLNNNQTVIGTWSIIPSAVNVEIIASTGIDFIIIDNEHGSISFEVAQSMITACELHKVSPIYRPPGVYEPDILKALDLGFHGIQVPNIANKYQVNKIIEYSKFPPSGNRGFSPFVRAGGYSHLNSEKHFNFANNNTLVGINIEGIDAITNVDEFLKIKELDILFIGAFDLSKALGIPGEVTNPKLLKHLQYLTSKIRESGKHVGTITTNEQQITQFIDFGMNYIVHLVDCEMIRSIYSETISFFKKQIK